MIYKELDSKQETLSTLKKLLKDSTSEKQKALISKDLNFLTNGIESEKQNAYYIDFYLSNSKNLIVLHDVRLEHNGRTAQIDHMLISRLGIELLESKSFKGQLTINEDESLEVNYNGTLTSFPNPMEQSKRHADVLKKFIQDNLDLGKRIDILGGFNIKNIVLIHPETTITNKKLPENFYRADTYISKRAEEVDKISFIGAIKLLSKMIDIDTAKEVATFIKNAHKPVEFDYAKKYKISKIKEENSQIIEKEIKNIVIVDEQIEPIKQKLKEGDLCPFCQKQLVLRAGKNKSSFLGCSGYPKCRFTRILSRDYQPDNAQYI